MKTQTTKYGVFEIGTPEYTSNKCWVRWDKYQANDGNVVDERVFAAGPTDDSDCAILPYKDSPYNRQYDARCASCFLHHGHTVARHDQNLTRSNQ